MLAVVQRLKTVAGTDRRDLQVQIGVSRMATVISEVFRSFLLIVDLHELHIVGVLFAVVSADPTLAFMNVKHG